MTRIEESTFVVLSTPKKFERIHLYIFVSVGEREGGREREREDKRKNMFRLSMTRETLKEEGCLAYCLSPVGLKQDLDGR